MKSVNNKVLLSLLGIAVATPFLVIGLAVGARAAGLVGSWQGDLLLVALVLGCLVASIGEGRIGLRGEAPARETQREAAVRTELRKMSTFTHGF